MTNINSFLNSIFKIKNSKILILIMMFSFTSRALSKTNIGLRNYESNTKLDKTYRNINRKFNSKNFYTRFLSDNQILDDKVQNNNDLNNKNNNLELDFEKLEADTKKWFLKKDNWDARESSSGEEENINWQSFEGSKQIQNESKSDVEQENIQNNLDSKAMEKIAESEIESNDDNILPLQNRAKSNTESNINRTPPVGEISVGEFLIPPRGYIELNGPEITLNLVDADLLETLKFLAKSGNYGFIYIGNQSDQSDQNEETSFPEITAAFTNQNYSMVFNSLLMAGNLQANFENGIIFVGENIFNKSLESKFSKTYRLNQASAASVGDYLSTLGAKISKVLVKSSALAGDELGSSLRNKAELSENFINSYGVEGGPLNGLIGTVDLRLQTITLVGEKSLISTAEKYIKSLDVRHRQVALSVKIIDVSLTKSDLTNNRFEARSGATYLINNGGFDLTVGNDSAWSTPPINGPVSSLISSGSLENNTFFNWLSRKITNDNAKIIASPTLILGENQEPIISGAAGVDDSLGSATIGRPFANEAFIKVGENVITSFEASTTDGVTTCSATSGTAGITFGAKLNKVDDNGFVTFSLSPAISSVTKTETVANCGTQSTLSVRKLDTGIIRVKDGSTLVLTGVLKDEDTINTTKTPLLGDLPFLGRLFRNNTTLKRKSELIILVTPNVINDGDA